MKDLSTKSSPDEFFESVLDSDVAKKSLKEQLRSKRLVSRLTALRAAKGLTQADVAAELGCNQSRVSKLEAGTDEGLSMPDIEGYARAVGLDITIFVAERGKTLAERIKFHANNIRAAFLQLVALSHNDSLIAQGVAELHWQAFQNINAMLAETAAKMPVNSENGEPYIRIEPAIEEELPGEETMSHRKAKTRAVRQVTKKRADAIA